MTYAVHVSSLQEKHMQYLLQSVCHVLCNICNSNPITIDLCNNDKQFLLLLLLYAYIALNT